MKLLTSIETVVEAKVEAIYKEVTSISKADFVAVKAELVSEVTSLREDISEVKAEFEAYKTSAENLIESKINAAIQASKGTN